MLSGFLFSVKSVKYEAKTKHLFLLKTAIFRKLLSHNTKTVQIQKQKILKLLIISMFKDF